MTTRTPVKPSITGTTLVPFTPTVSDDWAAAPGEVYLLTVIVGATATTITFDDPQATGPEGATAFNPDVSSGAVTSATKVFVVQSSRFLNPSTGKIAVAFSQVTNVSCELVGPIPRAT